MQTQKQFIVHVGTPKHYILVTASNGNEAAEKVCSKYKFDRKEVEKVRLFNNKKH